MEAQNLVLRDTVIDGNKLIEAFFSGRNKSTWEAYRADLQDFVAFLRFESLQVGVTQFVGFSLGEANRQVLLYRSSLVEKGLQASTVNRRLAAIRSLMKLARTLGFISWSIEISNLKLENYRDTRGPGMSRFCEMLSMAKGQYSEKASRDEAILRLLFDLALRASELVSLDLEDLDLERGTIAITAKGKAQKALLSVPDGSKMALARWLDVRGSDPGPLFLNFDRAKKGKRLTRGGLYELVRKFGFKIGIETRPHGLRHLSITEACKLAQANGFGLEEVLDHSRHASVATLMIYRDRERNVQGQIASLISSRLDRTKK